MVILQGNYKQTPRGFLVGFSGFCLKLINYLLDLSFLRCKLGKEILENVCLKYYTIAEANVK